MTTPPFRSRQAEMPSTRFGNKPPKPNALSTAGPNRPAQAGLTPVSARNAGNEAGTAGDRGNDRATQWYYGI